MSSGDTDKNSSGRTVCDGQNGNNPNAYFQGNIDHDLFYNEILWSSESE